MFRFFHNTVHVCTRSLACSALLQVPCTSSRCTHDQEAKETALREIPSPNGYRRCTVPGKNLPGRSCTSTVCDSSKTARSQTPRSRYGSARLPAPAEQHPYNLIYTYISYVRSCSGGWDFAATHLTSRHIHACFAWKELQ